MRSIIATLIVSLVLTACANPPDANDGPTGDPEDPNECTPGADLCSEDEECLFRVVHSDGTWEITSPDAGPPGAYHCIFCRSDDDCPEGYFCSDKGVECDPIPGYDAGMDAGGDADAGTSDGGDDARTEDSGDGGG